MASLHQRRGEPGPRRGANIAVAAIATAGGVAALFAYHTSPGHRAVLTSGSMAALLAPRPAQSARTAAPAKVQATAPAPSRTSQPAGKPAPQTVTGRPATTDFGIVQVQVTVRNGMVVAASAVQSPHSSQHSLQINQYAIPILNQEAVKAGSATIDAVSGATATSSGYLSSLQSALDQVHL